MIEYDKIFVLVGNSTDVNAVGENVMMFLCKSCGTLVADKSLHTKHHQTPVVG